MKFDIQVTVAEIANLLGLPYVGDPKVIINGIGPLDSAVSGDVAFLGKSLEGKQDDSALINTKASLVILAPCDKDKCQTNAILSENPSLSFAQLASHFYPKPTFKKGIHPSAVIGEGCQIAPTASIGPHVCIGDRVTILDDAVINAGSVIESDCKIGARTWIKANVTINTDVHLGDDCTVHSGAVLGGDGFGYANEKGRWHKVPQMGGVRIGNGVDIGSNTCVDRGTIEPTVIEDGVILDNLIQIGHNVKIGAHTAMAGCAGVAGSTKIGRYCMIGPRAAINGHLEIADGTIVTGLSAVSKSITQKGVYTSFFPALESGTWKRTVTRFYQLENLANRLKNLEKKVGVDRKATTQSES